MRSLVINLSFDSEACRSLAGGIRECMLKTGSRRDDASQQLVCLVPTEVLQQLWPLAIATRQQLHVGGDLVERLHLSVRLPLSRLADAHPPARLARPRLRRTPRRHQCVCQRFARRWGARRLPPRLLCLIFVRRASR